MSSRFRGRRQCLRADKRPKVRRTRDEANAAADRDRYQRAYWCYICGWWHVGRIGRKNRVHATLTAVELGPRVASHLAGENMGKADRRVDRILQRLRST